MTPLPPIVLCFAGNDPSGGAGLAADILTLAALGCHPLPIVTALTVQDSSSVEEIQAVDADLVSDQARLLLEDMPVAAIKVGVIGSVENLAVIAEIAADYPHVPLILDPILASGGGDELASDELIAALRELLLPHTFLITPNSLEARRLASDDADEQDAMSLDHAARSLLDFGCQYALITGTHEASSNVINTLFHGPGRVRSDTWQRLPASYHGSGCTLAAAVAGKLALGLPVAQAVRAAQEYTYQTLTAGFRPGMGQHIPQRLYWGHV